MEIISDWLTSNEDREKLKKINLDDSLIDNIYDCFNNRLEGISETPEPVINSLMYNKYGNRYFIGPNGKFYQIYLSHPKTERALIEIGALPKSLIEFNNRGCPILEKLGFIRILLENAIILNDTPPTQAQYYSIEKWIMEFGKFNLEYYLVFPNGEQFTINPINFDNFKTTNYAIGLIRKFYKTY